MVVYLQGHSTLSNTNTDLGKLPTRSAFALLTPWRGTSNPSQSLAQHSIFQHFRPFGALERGRDGQGSDWWLGLHWGAWQLTRTLVHGSLSEKQIKCENLGLASFKLG